MRLWASGALQSLQRHVEVGGSVVWAVRGETDKAEKDMKHNCDGDGCPACKSIGYDQGRDAMAAAIGRNIGRLQAQNEEMLDALKQFVRLATNGRHQDLRKYLDTIAGAKMIAAIDKVEKA